MKKTIKIYIFVLLILICITACADYEDTIVSTIETIIETINETINEFTYPTEEETVQITFSDNITFSCKYINEDSFMPYALFTPSSASESESVPLIVWLHGSGEREVVENTFLRNGLPKVLKEWKLEGFNAYVLCPQLRGEYNSGDWIFPESADNLKSLLNNFVANHNVDTENIIIAGHSLGGKGAMYMACKFPNYFSKMVVLSGFNPHIDISEITIPSIGYVGMSRCGEHNESISYMKNVFIQQFGQDSLYFMESSHGELPMVVFNEDKNGNNRSDIIEWIFDVN